MMSKYFLLLLMVFITHYFTGVHAQITCYNCNSFTDGIGTGALCQDPMNPNVGTITCSGGYVCTRVFYRTSQIFVTSRSCDPSGNTCNNIRNGLERLYPDLSGFQCRTCNTNFCNHFSAGFIVNRSLSVLVFSAILSKLL